MPGYSLPATQGDVVAKTFSKMKTAESIIYLERIFWCTLYFILGPALIILNNHVFNTIHYKFPILFSSLGIWGTAIVSIVLRRLGFAEKGKDISMKFWATRILPIGVLSAASIATGNSVYLHLSVSFTQMLKALSPVYIFLFMTVLKVEIPNRLVMLAVAVISMGSIISLVGELKFSWIGFLLQSLADVFEGCRLVMTQVLLSNNVLTPMESLYYVFPATAVSQLFLVMIREQRALTEPANWTLAMDNWHLFLLAITLGTAMNFVGIFVIKHTSGMMLKLIGVVRNNCLVLLAVIFLGDKTSAVQIFGYLVSIGGFVWYSKLSAGGVSHEKTPVMDKVQYSPISNEDEPTPGESEEEMKGDFELKSP